MKKQSVHFKKILLLVCFSVIFGGGYLCVPASALAATISRPIHNSGLIGYWSFDVGKGGLTAYDMSGQGNHGTLTAMDAGSDWVDGQVKTALDFDGSDDEVDVDAIQSDLSSGTAVTVAGWIYIASYGDSGSAEIRQIIGDDVSGEDGTVAFRVGADGTSTNEDVLYGQVVTQGTGNQRDTISGITELALNRWHHVVFTWQQNGRKRLYIDGVLDADEAASASAIDNAPTGTLFIGDDDTRSRNWHGKMDEIRIYNRALSAQEIERLYRVSAPRLSTTRDVVTDGLVGHWTFDGNEMTPGVLDRSGQGNHGFLSGFTSTTTVIGRLGQALEFDGIDDYLRIGSGTDGLVEGEAAASVCFWMNYLPVSVAKDGALVSTWQATTNGLLFWIDNTAANSGRTNTLSFAPNTQISPGGRVEGSTNLVSSQTWDHYCGTFQGGSFIRLYKNGVLDQEETTSVVSTVFSNDNWLLVANSQDASSIKNSNIRLDDLRIYDRALSTEEVQRIYTAGAPSRMNRTPTNRFAQGLIGHWSFDGNVTDTTKTYDVSGAGNHGTLVGGPTQMIGRLGQALHFDGSDDYVSLGSSSIIGSDTTFTISAWVKSDDWRSGFQSTLYGEFSGESNTKNYLGVIGTQGDETALTPGQLFLDQFPPSGGFLGSNTIMDEDQWYHVVGVENGATRALYINGVLDVSAASDAYSGTAPNSVRIGNRPTGSQTYFFQGAIDDVRIYSRALTADEVAQLYNMGS